LLRNTSRGHTNPSEIIDADFGKRIAVWWSDDDGDRWEEGVIFKQCSARHFDVKYDFLDEFFNEDLQQIDLVVTEKLLGEKSASWYYVID